MQRYCNSHVGPLVEPASNPENILEVERGDGPFLRSIDITRARELQLNDDQNLCHRAEYPIEPEEDGWVACGEPRIERSNQLITTHP